MTRFPKMCAVTHTFTESSARLPAYHSDPDSDLFLECGFWLKPSHFHIHNSVHISFHLRYFLTCKHSSASTY
jgi:hypothetical protein